MCVIIHRQPNVDIPFEKLQSACLVNSDGWGIAIPDRGKLELRRVYEPKGNNPDQIAKILEDAKGLDVFLHLRFKTKGATDLKNVHPFTVTSRKLDGIDVQFMHNGTLSDFGNQADCDSKIFAREIVRPLYTALYDSMGDKAMTSPIFSKIMHKYAGPASLFAIVDSKGNNLIVNRSKGVQHEGWWSSNDYSFNRTHRESTTTSYYGTSGYYSKWHSTGRSLQKEEPAPVTQSEGSVERSSALVAESTVPFGPKPNDIPEVTGNTQTRRIIPKGDLPKLTQRQTFCEVADIVNLEECCLMSADNVKELVIDYPEHATLLIMDLLTELYDTKFDDSEVAE